MGAVIAFQEVGFTAAFPGVYAYNALTVGGGELIACFALGLPLLAALERAGVPERLAA